eukprot:scaffold8.g1661.t1
METVFSTAELGAAQQGKAALAVRRPWPRGRADSQDSLLDESGTRAPAEYCLLAVLDGGPGGPGGPGGAAVASLADALVLAVELLLPSAATLERDSSLLAGGVQAALLLAALELHRRLAAAGCPGAGASAVLVLQVGALVTCASLGSCRCLLHTGGRVVLLSADHRAGGSKAERARLHAAGCEVAPAAGAGTGRGAPLRVWPGGSSVTRALGALASGARGVLPLPHVRQVLLPPSGGRLVLGSAAVWSRLAQGVGRVVREAPVASAADKVAAAAAGGGSCAPTAGGATTTGGTVVGDSPSPPSSPSSPSGGERVMAVVCADVLPPLDSWQGLLARLARGRRPAAGAGTEGGAPQPRPEDPARRPARRQPPAADGGGGGATAALAAGKRMLGLLGLRRSGSDPALARERAQGAGEPAALLPAGPPAARAASESVYHAALPPEPPTPAVLADLDTAALLGLAPPGGAAGGGAAGAASGGAGGGEAAPGAGPAAPPWWSEELRAEDESYLAYHAALQRQAAATGAGQPAATLAAAAATAAPGAGGAGSAAPAEVAPALPSPFGAALAWAGSDDRASGALPPPLARPSPAAPARPPRQGSLPAAGSADRPQRSGSLRSILKPSSSASSIPSRAASGGGGAPPEAPTPPRAGLLRSVSADAVAGRGAAAGRSAEAIKRVSFDESTFVTAGGRDRQAWLRATAAERGEAVPAAGAPALLAPPLPLPPLPPLPPLRTAQRAPLLRTATAPAASLPPLPRRGPPFGAAGVAVAEAGAGAGRGPAPAPAPAASSAGEGSPESGSPPTPRTPLRRPQVARGSPF